MSLATRIRSGALHPALLPRELFRRGLAYGGFLACGLVLAGAFALNWLPTGGWPYRALAFVYRLPMLLLFFVGGLLGGGMALAVWREWRLLALTALTAAAPALPWLALGEAEVWDAALAAFYVLYTLLALLLPLRWFAVDRRRLLERHPPKNEGAWL